MTIAIDVKTGAVVGQVCSDGFSGKTCAGLWPAHEDAIRILTREGYRHVRRSSVRLEELR